MQHHHSASLTSDHDDHGDPHDESHHSDHHDDGHHDNKASEHGFESLSQGHRDAQGAGEHSKLDAVLSQLQNRLTDPGETADQINPA